MWGKAQRLARPAAPLAACVQQISCTSYRALPHLPNVTETPFSGQIQQKLVGTTTSLEVSTNWLQTRHLQP